MSHGEVYRSFLQLCQPYYPGGVWHEFREARDLWTPPADPVAALRVLREQFDEGELREAGVVIGEPDGSTELNPSLCGPRAIILALRETAKDAPLDLVVEAGTLPGELPVCAAMKDLRMKKAAANIGYMALTFTMEDLAALRLMEVPAVPARGLAQMGRETLAEFRQYLEQQGSPGSGQNESPSVSPPNTGSGTAQPSSPPGTNAPVMESFTSEADPRPVGAGPELVFVAWSPADLNPLEPEALGEVVSHFVAIEQYLHVSVDDVYVWRPARAELDRVAFCLERGARKDVREAILASMDQSTEPITAPAKRPAVPRTLPEAMLELENVLHGAYRDEHREKHAWVDYEEQVNNSLALPLLQMAMRTAEPVERNLMVTTASIARVLHPQAMLIAARIGKRIAESGFAKLGRVPEKDVRCLLNLTDRLIDLNKELQQCNQRARSKPVRR